MATGRTGRRGGLTFGSMAGTTGDSLPAAMEDARHDWALAIAEGSDETEPRERFLMLQHVDREVQTSATHRGCGGRIRAYDTLGKVGQ